MRQLLIGFIVFVMSFGIVSPILNVSAAAMNTNMSRYQATANRTISQYVSKLENAQYTDTQILSALTKLRTTYTQKKYLSNYRWTRKTQIDTIIIALNNAISDLDTNDDVYDDFNHVVTTTTATTPSCSYDTRTCSDGSTVRRAGPYCQFATCPTTLTTTTPVVTNNITGITSSNPYWLIQTRFIAQNQNALYKEYDVYLYTPNSSKNNQPSATTFIPKPERLIYDYYNSYTITTNFQSETDSSKIGVMRFLAAVNPPVNKTSVILSKDSSYWYFTPLPDTSFSRDAVLVPSTWKSNYTTYFLYIAKDNSEAFTVNYVQSGMKKQQNWILSLNLNAVKLNAWDLSFGYNIDQSVQKNYQECFYVAPPTTDVSRILGVLDLNQTTMFWVPWTFRSEGKEFTLWIYWYKISPDQVSIAKSMFWTNCQSPANFSSPSFTLQSYSEYQTKKLSDNTYRTFRLVTDMNNSEAYLTMMTQTEFK